MSKSEVFESAVLKGATFKWAYFQSRKFVWLHKNFMREYSAILKNVFIKGKSEQAKKRYLNVIH
jgi:hypothetical protein